MPELMPLESIQQLECSRLNVFFVTHGWNVRRYQYPAADTIFPLEYAFHLLNDIRGRTIVELGCGHGFSAAVMAALGAQVIAVDASNQNLASARQRASMRGVSGNVTFLRSDDLHIPVADARADRVLCRATAESSDLLVLARQIRRILKPGGLVVFYAESRGNLITNDYACALSRAVGVAGQSREFGLTSTLVDRIGFKANSRAVNAAHKLDAALLRRFPFARPFASSLIWEARKEF